MTRGRKYVPAALRTDGRDLKPPEPPDALPRCPPHLNDAARKEWRRLATPLWRMGVLTVADRAAMAAYCQAWARWVEAEEKLAETPPLLKTPSGYFQQSPWLSIANKQMELMNRFAAELGLTPASRMRLATKTEPSVQELRPVQMTVVRFTGDVDRDDPRDDEPGLVVSHGDV